LYWIGIKDVYDNLGLYLFEYLGIAWHPSKTKFNLLIINFSQNHFNYASNSIKQTLRYSDTQKNKNTKRDCYFLNFASFLLCFGLITIIVLSTQAKKHKDEVEEARQKELEQNSHK